MLNMHKVQKYANAMNTLMCGMGNRGDNPLAEAHCPNHDTLYRNWESFFSFL